MRKGNSDVTFGGLNQKIVAGALLAG